MKFVKLSILAMAMGLFVTSCGNNENKDAAATNDSAAMAPAAPAPTAPAPAPADTMHKMDTTAHMADTAKKM